MVKLREKPYYLSDEDIKWVEDTINGMTDEEKIGQLFFNMGSSREEDYLKMTVDQYHIGGIRYNPATAAEVHEQNRILQEHSKIPLIIACNTEGGGNGACTDGTLIGMPVKIGSTRDEHYAYEMGRISNREAAAIGCNLSFAPLSDIYYNWHNPVIGLRNFGNDPDQVAAMATAYLKGAHENPGFCCAAKHFPGDGLDDRDQHIANSVNTFSCEEWDETYGKVYRSLIDEGVEAIMAGHIMQPAYTRYFNPQIKDEDIQPATLSPELIEGLLKGKLGFNGMVLTDASHMVGLTCRMKRSEMLPRTIAAGVDMFLFFNDMDEDFASMMEGYRSGIITEERLTDALRRILGLKAHMGLNKKAKTELVPPAEQISSIIGCQEHKNMAREIAEKGTVLVKYLDKDVLPITPEKYKRIMIVYVKGVEAGGMGFLVGGGKGRTPAEKLKDKLTEKGFDVFVYESPIEKMKKRMEAGEKVDLNLYFAGKDTISEFAARQDLILTVCNVAGGFQAVARPGWGMTKGGGEIPWYVHEVPVVALNLGHPTIMADMPQVRTFINAYDSTDTTLDVLVEKLLTGAESFTGEDPIDSFCGLWDAHF